MSEHSLQSRQNINAQQCQAVLRLAERLLSYGQVERALSVLDFLCWLAPENDEALVLRLKALTMLKRWCEAADLVASAERGLDKFLLAKICWALGDAALGDRVYRLPERDLSPRLLSDVRISSVSEAPKPKPDQDLPTLMLQGAVPPPEATPISKASG